MDKEPKKIIIRLLEATAIFALSMFLLKLGMEFLAEFWWGLLIVTLLLAGAVVGYRFWKNKGNP